MSFKYQAWRRQGATGMADARLVAIVVLTALLSLGHTADHICRGDVRLALTMESLLAIVFNVAIYAVIGVGLYLYVKRRVGPLFWAFFAGAGLAALWLAHLSPFTDQPPQYIFRAYESAAAGWLALACLFALALALIAGALYAEYLWARASR
jgi:hypothetical protein